VPVTFAKIGPSIIVDATADEEYAMNARVTVTTSDTLNAMQKGGVGSFTVDEIRQCVDQSFKIGSRLRKQVEG